MFLLPGISLPKWLSEPPLADFAPHALDGLLGLHGGCAFPDSSKDVLGIGSTRVWRGAAVIPLQAIVQFDQILKNQRCMTQTTSCPCPAAVLVPQPHDQDAERRPRASRSFLHLGRHGEQCVWRRCRKRLYAAIFICVGVGWFLPCDV